MAWAQQPPASLSSDADAASAKPAPDAGLTDQILYQFLISEIAGQRGRAGLAARGLIDLAQKTRDARVARRAAEVAFQARDLSSALDATTLWVELDPDSAVARQAMATLAGSQGTLESAKSSLAALLAQPNKAPTVLLQLNALLARFQDKTEVAAAVRDLSEPYLVLPEARYARAAAYAGAKQWRPAMAEIEEAQLRRPDWAQVAILKSQVLRETRDAKAAEDSLAKFLVVNPDAIEVRLAYARLLAAEKAYVPAREQFRIAKKSQPNDIEIPYSIGLLSQQLKDWDDADAELKRVLEMMPRDPAPVYFNLGLIAEGRKDMKAAEEWFGRVEGGDYFVSSRLKIAGIRVKRDGMEAGRKYLREAQAAQQDAPEMRNQLILAEAQLLRDAKALPAAFKLLSEAAQHSPDAADLLYDRAMVAEKLGKLDVMEADLRRVIALKPDHAHAYNALGYTFAERNLRLDEAYELVQKAVALAPQDAYIQDSLGWIQYRQGRIDEAYKTLKQAYTQRRDPEIAAHLGEIMWIKGERDEAVKLWRASLLENPDNEMLTAVIKKYQP